MNKRSYSDPYAPGSVLLILLANRSGTHSRLQICQCRFPVLASRTAPMGISLGPAPGSAYGLRAYSQNSDADSAPKRASLRSCQEPGPTCANRIPPMTLPPPTNQLGCPTRQFAPRENPLPEQKIGTWSWPAAAMARHTPPRFPCRGQSPCTVNFRCWEKRDLAQDYSFLSILGAGYGPRVAVS